MSATAQRKASEVNRRKLHGVAPRVTKAATVTERIAQEMALEYITKNGIKPRMTLKEFADFFNMPLGQVQSDARRNYLPLMPRIDPNRRELMQVNMVAYYAMSLAASNGCLEKAAAFQ